MKPIQGYHLIKPEDLSWQTSRMMQIPNADFLERTMNRRNGRRSSRLPLSCHGRHDGKAVHYTLEDDSARDRQDWRPSENNATTSK
jgi:hypothetical protein